MKSRDRSAGQPNSLRTPRASAAAIAAAGVVTGLLAGLFGIGGGAVIVPVLYEVFRV